jgi:hypothetical protein
MLDAKLVWVFDENRCVFQRASLCAATDSFVAIWRDVAGDLWVRVDEQVQRWQDGDTLFLAGLRFDFDDLQ